MNAAINAMNRSHRHTTPAQEECLQNVAMSMFISLSENCSHSRLCARLVYIIIRPMLHLNISLIILWSFTQDQIGHVHS